MKQKTFAVMGATGHIGHIVVEDLLKRGHIVRAIGRDVDKLHHLELKGAHLVISEFDDVQLLTEAFQDTYAVFTLIPPSYHETDYAGYQDRISEAIVKAIADSGVQRVVNLSSIGADQPSGTGFIAGLYRHEQRLNKLKNLTTLLQLRAAYFMDNLTFFIPSILNQQVIRYPLDGNLPIPMVATRDIGWKAADLLDSTATFSNKVFEFVGPKDVTLNHVTELLSCYLEIPELHYEMISFAEAKNLLRGHEMSDPAVDLYLEMVQAFNSGLIKPTTELTLTHKGSTTIEAFLLHVAHRLHAPLSS